MRLAIAMTNIATSFSFMHLHSLSLFPTEVGKSMGGAGGVLIDAR
jgi:hypothetical protein